MRISKSNKTDVTASAADKSPKGNVFFDEDGIRVTAIGDGNNGTIGIVENTTDTDYDISDYTIDLTVPAHGTLELNADEEGWDTIWYFRKLHAKPLTPEQIKDLWDKESLFMILEDGSDVMCQENDYTLDDVLGMTADVYRDNDPDILPDPWENNVKATTKMIKKTKVTSGRWINGLNNKVIYDDGGIKVTTTGRDYDIIAVIENDTDEVFCVNIYEPDYEDPDDCNVVVQPHDYIGVLADDEGYDIVEYFENLAGGVKACGDIKGSTNLKPAQRTAADGKTWWVVFDDATHKYLDTLTYFGKYKTKTECQQAIDRAIDKYGDSLQRTLNNHRKYFSDVTTSADVCATSANDRALSHIKAAIDILGKSGKKDDVTKDSIANLATVMFDIKSSKKN